MRTRTERIRDAEFTALCLGGGDIDRARVRLVLAKSGLRRALPW